MVLVHLPVGIAGWTIFVTGLLITGYRVHGIDAPRAWIEWTERQFASSRNVQTLGVMLALASVGAVYFGSVPGEFLGWLFILSAGTLFVSGLLMILATNTVRHIVIATAESGDKTIKLVSGAIVVLGLLWALAPWFL